MKLLASAALVFLTACATSPSGGNPADGSSDGVANGSGPSERVFGTIEFYSDPVRVVVPSSVQQGQLFVVTVVTYGGGCIEKGETDVEVEALQAEIRPYDLRHLACPAHQRGMYRRAELVRTHRDAKF